MFLGIYLAVNTVSGAGKDVREGLADKIAAFADYLIGRIPSWIAGFIVFAASFFIARLVKSAVESRIEKQIDDEHQEILVLAGRVSYFGALTLGITIALKIAGIDLTTILAAVAFGVGFALKDLIMNFLAGVMILVSRQFIIGDFIKIGDTLGKVVEIQTRATILKGIDGTKIIVPNGEIFRRQVTSLTTNPTRRVVVPLYVAYDTDLKFAAKIAIEVLKKHPKILKKPGPSVIIQGYGDSSVDLSARFWVGSRDGWFKIKSEVMQKLLSAFDEAGIVIPYNILHLETGQDTLQEWKDAAGRREKRKAEMELSKAVSNPLPAPAPTSAPSQNQNGAAPAALTPAAVPVVAQAPIPPGVYTDEEESDGIG